MALLLGLEPISFLSQSGANRVVTEAVVTRAWELRIEEIQAGAMSRLI